MKRTTRAHSDRVVVTATKLPTTTDSTLNMIEIQKCSKGLRDSLYLVHHYFMRVPELNIEIHPGLYVKGVILDLNTTKKYTIKSKSYICKSCVNFLLSYIHLTKHTWFYPVINCETLTNGICHFFPVSFQLSCAMAAGTILCLNLSNVFKIILVLTIGVLLFVYQNDCFRRRQCARTFCIHIPDSDRVIAAAAAAECTAADKEADVFQ